MTKKLLKIELFSLFTLTLMSFIYFYFGSGLPDNLFQISSSGTSFNLITFYSSSIVAYCGYFVGPWIFFTFIVYSLFYSLIFSQREFKLDPFVFIILALHNVLFFKLFAPQFLGSSLFELINSNFSTLSSMIYLIILTILLFGFSFRENFFSYVGFYLKKSYLYIRVVFTLLFNLNFTNTLRNFILFFTKKIVGLKLLISSSLQNKNNDIEIFRTSTNKYVQKNNLNNNIVASRSTFGDLEVISETVTNKSSNKVNNSKSNINKNELIEKNINEVDHTNYFELVSKIPEAQNKINVKNPDNQYFSDIIDIIETKLSDFKIDGKIVNILKGPVVDTYELELGTGVRISKVINSEKDLSVALFGAPIRLVYPMIGRTTVGIEVPRNPREIIYLDELINTNIFQTNHYHLPVILGKDAFGEPFIKDLATMPHMLVAGSTGSGKSVFINTLLISLLVKKSPQQMRLILIDPKQLELALYSKLPHLLLPVITKAKSAFISLLWAVEEMERRYTLLKETGVRGIDGFNSKIKRSGADFVAKVKSFYDEADDNSFELPYIVIIVDEFADLILTKSGKDIETNICRLAAKARAAGIHLILATQRPSVDVVTGLIKANFPIRVSFKVSSGTDSRTILDSKGAEKLLGKGDMIFKHGTTIGRVHSAYIGEEEIEILTKSLENIDLEFNDEAMNFLENEGDSSSIKINTEGGSFNLSSSDISKDDIFKDAVKVVMEQKTASASMLQRRLRIGYNRAANLIEEMEEKGIVGPAEGAKRRKVLILE